MYHSVFFRGSQAMIKNASVYIDMGDALLSRRTLLEAGGPGAKPPEADAFL
jgi:hypothetical protein